MSRARVLFSLVAAGFGLLQAQTNPEAAPETAKSLLASATNLYNESHYPEAIEQLQRAEALARSDNDIDSLLEIKQVEGNALRTLGRVDDALRAYEEWFQLNRELPYPQPAGRATRFLAILYREMGDIDKSEIYVRQALKLARAEKNPQLEAGCLLSMGALQKDRGRYVEAIPWHEQALALAEREKLDRLQAEILNSLGDAENHAGRLEHAENHFRRAMEIAKATNYLGLEAQVTARTGEIDKARGRYADAIRLFARANELNHQLGDPITKEFAVDLDWAQAERAAGHPENALAHYRDAIGEVEKLEQLTVPTELARALPVATSREAYEEAVDLLMELNRPAEALELADSGRARAFVDILVESHVDVRPSNPAFAELRRPASAKTDDIQRELAGNDTAFIEYSIGDARSYAWVVTGHGVDAAPLAERKRIEPLIASYRNLLAQPVTNLTPEYRTRLVRTQAGELYRLLIAPIEQFVGGKKRLIIVPDGGLANLPMESLIDSKGRYWLEEHTVVYSQSASASLTLGAMARRMPAPQAGALVFGDPAYDSSSFAPIPYTREEAEGVARQFPPQERELYLGPSASEAALKREDLDRFGYLHFAVHGLVDNSNPARSGLVLAREPGGSADGVLRSAEIARLKMNAQLVVLSGCRTADGKLLQGEGLLTISRSFYYAGARAVVATLWNVDDVSTTELMKTFYSRIRAGLAPEDALRQAKVEMARGNQRLWKNPWFWSPFIISR